MGVNIPNMRVAYLAHFYPPSPCGGVGYYTANLAEAFADKGMNVGVLCVDKWGEGRHYFNGSIDEQRNGVFVRRLHINWRNAPRPFDWQYYSPILANQAREFFTHFRPDIVHVSSCYTLSTSPVMVARALGLPIILHLHDYWTICARLTLLHKDNAICSGPEDAWKCQQCLLAGTKAWRLTDALLGATAQKRLFEDLADHDWATRLPSLHGMLGNLHRRQTCVANMIRAADVLVAPTAFARDILMRHIPQGAQIKVIPNGIRLDWARNLSPTFSPQLRIGFLGSVLPIKGVHVLVDAYRVLQQQGYHVRLEICGETDSDPGYCQELRNSTPDGVIWRGRYERGDLSQILENLDLVVVPSICFETQGLVIQEAFAAGLPVVVSAGTSLTETVDNGVNGLHFRMGSADDLAAQLRRLLEEPDLLATLRSNIPAIRTNLRDVAAFSEIYTALVESYSASQQ